MKGKKKKRIFGPKGLLVSFFEDNLYIELSLYTASHRGSGPSLCVDVCWGRQGSASCPGCVVLLHYICFTPELLEAPPPPTHTQSNLWPDMLLCVEGWWGLLVPAALLYMMQIQQFVRFEIFMVVTMKNGVFWDVMACGSCKNRRFGGT
jgi:hypothetical protein